MNLDDQLESMEATGQTEAEEIDEATEIQDVEDDVDETLGPNAEESDLEHAYASFETDNEADYNGYEPFEVEESEADEMVSDDLHSEGYHVETAHDLEEEVIEMEIEEGDIYAYLVDEDDNEVGFILIDENGDKQQYYYVDMDKYELGVAAQKIYDFIWDDYCDWYIELTKTRLQGEDEDSKVRAQQVLCWVLTEMLKLLHPFMPFITEEIWQALPHGDSMRKSPSFMPSP